MTKAKKELLKFDVLNRWSGEVKFTAEIDCAADALPSVKMGLAVKWAIKSRADLAGAYLAGAYLAGADLARADLAGAYLTGANLARADLAGAYLAGADLADAYLAGANLAGANLADAYLAGANLTGANLARADLVDGGQRSDGYRFVGSIKDGLLMISAGCRYFAIADAREHWKHREGTPLGAETTCILDHIEKVAAIRGLLPATKQEAA